MALGLYISADCTKRSRGGSDAPMEDQSVKKNGDGSYSLGTGSAWRESCCMSPITLKRIVTVDYCDFSNISAWPI